MNITTLQYPFKFKSAKLRVVLMVVTALYFLIPAIALAQNVPPVVDAGEDQTVFVDEIAHLEGSATDANGNPILSWQWTVDSPEGSSPRIVPSDLPVADFTADLAGDYVLSLIAWDGLDWSLPDFVTIHVIELLPPEAVATADVTSGDVPLTVQFDGSQSQDPHSGGLSYSWNFGDGSLSSQEKSPTHVYEVPGSFTAVLRVFDTYGQSDFDFVNIEVTALNNPPTVSVSATPTSGTAPLDVAFSAGASDPDGNNMTFDWDFGDGSYSTEENPNHTYLANGTYVAWLTVSDGALDVSDSITIVVSPIAALLTSRAVVERDSQTVAEKGTISYWADINLPTPGPNDTICFTFDDEKLFTQPFSNFEAGEDPDTYVLVKNRLLVRVDLAANTLFVSKERANLKKLDHTNGIDIELLWGGTTAVDQFEMVQTSYNEWVYESSGQ